MPKFLPGQWASRGALLLITTRIVGLFEHPHEAKYESPWLLSLGSKVVDTIYHKHTYVWMGLSPKDH